MNTAVLPQLPTSPFELVYDDGETHLVEVVCTYTDGCFDVRPAGTTDPEWTIYPVELAKGVVTIKEG